jgi:hypothetical protein
MTFHGVDDVLEYYNKYAKAKEFEVMKEISTLVIMENSSTVHFVVHVVGRLCPTQEIC